MEEHFPSERAAQPSFHTASALFVSVTCSNSEGENRCDS